MNSLPPYYYIFTAHSLADTERLGITLANFLPDGTTVALIGTLGAGKTRLVQALASGCGIPAKQVTSPTFVLCQHHQGKRLLHHVDVYRLRDEDEFLELGPEEWFYSSGITLVEWADRFPLCLPPDRLEITIEVVSEETRQFTLRSVGHFDPQILTAISENLQNMVS